MNHPPPYKNNPNNNNKSNKYKTASLDQDDRWIEAESATAAVDHSRNLPEGICNDDEGVTSSFLSLSNMFLDPDPYDSFKRTYEICNHNYDDDDEEEEEEEDGDSNINNNNNIHHLTITLRGYKAENGQTLDSTGMTIWQASGILCRYIIAYKEELLIHKDRDLLLKQQHLTAGNLHSRERSSSIESDIFYGKNNRAGNTVLELGAGLGECGILAYKLNLARRVIITDGDTDVLQQMRKNVDYNLNVPGSCVM